MAKDPAMLWYWGDWHSGTALLSRFLKGCYIDILHAQFNNGPLSLEEIKICLGSDFGTSWPTLQKKFITSDAGLYFNERLELEKEKRKQFAESRKNNGLKGGRPKASDKPSALHMPNHTEDRNINAVFSIEECLEISLKDGKWVKENRTNRHELEKFNQELRGTGETERNPKDYKRHFYYWKKNGKLETGTVKKMVL